jgi:hypothetical protein
VEAAKECRLRALGLDHRAVPRQAEQGVLWSVIIKHSGGGLAVRVAELKKRPNKADS